MPDDTTEAREVLAAERYGPLLVQPACPTDEQRRGARQSELYQRGDMKLVWVSEGDLDMLLFAASARQSAIEEAARVADATANERNAHPEYNMGCWDTAAAIRQLGFSGEEAK